MQSIEPVLLWDCSWGYTAKDHETSREYINRTWEYAMVLLKDKKRKDLLEKLAEQILKEVDQNEENLKKTQNNEKLSKDRAVRIEQSLGEELHFIGEDFENGVENLLEDENMSLVWESGNAWITSIEKVEELAE